MDIYEKAEMIRQIQKKQEEQESAWYQRGDGKRTMPPETGIKSRWSDFFRLRFMIAILLFLCLFVMKKEHWEIAGITYARIVEYLGTNMELEQIFSFGGWG